MYVYQGGEFVRTFMFCWFSETNENTPVYMAKCELRQGPIDSEIVIESIYVSVYYEWPKKTAPELFPYYIEGSFWDLDSRKWSCFFRESEQKY